MLIIPLYDLCAADAQLSAMLSDDTGLKVGEFDADNFANAPYVCWQTITATTEQYLDDPSDMDNLHVQIDVYAKSKGDCRQIASLVRQVIEHECYIEDYTGVIKDTETNLYRISLDTSWYEEP